MADQHEKGGELGLAPVLLEPRDEEVVDARAVTFQWRPARNAVDYRLQVSADVTFETLVLERPIGRDTTVTITDAFPADEATYYWRVVATDAEGGVHGTDTIGSFISGTPEEGAMHLARPDEDLGPGAALVRGAAVEVAAEATQDEKYFAQEAAMGVEHEGIPAGQIMGIALAVSVSLVLIIVVLIQYVNISAQDVRHAVVGMSGYPEVREHNLAATQRLSGYGTVEGQPGVYRIPIDRAIELMANEAYQAQGRTYAQDFPAPPRP